MSAINRVILLGNRTLSILVAHFLRRQPGITLMAVANPDDTGRDGPGGLSLVRRLKAWGIPYIQPKGISSEAVVSALRAFGADLAISCSYARIIPKAVIDLPKYGCLNIHFASLPVNRGCLPVIWTLAGCETTYAATLHMVDVGIDDGAIIDQAIRPLVPGTTAAEANAACAALGFDLFRAFWEKARESGQYVAVPQDAAAATYHTFRFPHDRWIPWHEPAERVAGLINAHTFLPHPSARTRLDGAEDETCLLGPALAMETAERAQPGTILVAGDELIVACGGGAIVLQSCRDLDTAAPVTGRFSVGQRFVSPRTEFYQE